MNVETLKETFFTMVSPDIPNEWDVEEAVESLAFIDEQKCQSVLNQVSVIWPVSHSLCFDYLKTVASALDCFEPDNLSEWVNSTLDQYEKLGLRAAQRYMADVDGNFLCPLRGESGVPFKQVYGRLLPYLRGLSGMSLDLAPHDVVHTDTSTIFMPHEINLFADNKDNIFMYKLIVSYQWAYIASSSYTVCDVSDIGENDNNGLRNSLWLKDFLHSFSNPRLASDLYHLLETIRVTAFLENELPGLMRQKESLPVVKHPENSTSETISGTIQYLQDIFLDGNKLSLSRPDTDKVLELVQSHKIYAFSAVDSVKLTEKLFELIHDEQVEYIPVEPLLHQGFMRLEAVHNARDQRLEQLKDLFVDALATRLLKHSQEKKKEPDQQQESAVPGAAANEDGVAVVIESQQQSDSGNSDATMLITIDNEQIVMDDELQFLAENIINDLGYLPEKYVTSAVGKAGKGYAAFRTAGAEKGSELITPITYDEWDYRRNDFRKKWCSVLEKQIPLTQSVFYQSTLEKYYGEIRRLRYQFEMMRSTERFVRRQRDGDDIDLDSLIESVADVRAGLAPSDRLFIRLKRDERDIAVLFLIDMSNSTQGWVNEAIKESLVLLCEALEIVGDRYGIYGFSGMRRLRSEFFHIKHFDEPYDDVVKQRISSIAPREYTRMGPALRHATTLLKDVDSRVRLLITLSDGKPEDYDDYKGEYAVEDTWHALIEAKAAGIHPFCITVDRHAQDYIDRMYGSVNYIQIDDVKKLPHKMPEIYRVLTN
jgi:nitric oxide reductase NorD protein